jgi:hypothetical protein
MGEGLALPLLVSAVRSAVPSGNGSCDRICKYVFCKHLFDKGTVLRKPSCNREERANAPTDYGQCHR